MRILMTVNHCQRFQPLELEAIEKIILKIDVKHITYG